MLLLSLSLLESQWMIRSLSIRLWDLFLKNAIKEVHDLSKMNVHELIGPLMTYELSLDKVSLNHVTDDSTIVASSYNHVDICISTDDDKLSDEVLADTYKVLYYKWIEKSQGSENQSGRIESLMTKNNRLL